jgi:hypothetical protein
MRCPKCSGCLYHDYEYVRCLNCGLYLIEPVCPPIVVEEARRWESVLCNVCHIRGAVRKHNTCRQCWYTRGVA